MELFQAPGDQTCKSKMGKRKARTNRPKLKYMNNPVGIYHIYVTLNNQQRNLALEEKLKPFEKSFMQDLRKSTGRNIGSHDSMRTAPTALSVEGHLLNEQNQILVEENAKPS